MEQQYMVLKVIQMAAGVVVEAVPSQGINVVFSKAKAEEVFESESAVPRARVTLEIREVGDVLRRRKAKFIDEPEDDL